MNERMHSWLSALTDAAWMVDPRTLRLMAANEPAAALLGLEREAMQGLPAIELMATPEDTYFWEDVAAGLADTLHSHSLVRTMSAQPVAVDRKVSRVWLGPQEPVFLVTLRDLRPQLEREALLEERLADIRATLESTQDALLVTDLDGRIKHYNGRFVDLWSVPEELLSPACEQALLAHMQAQVADVEHYQQRLAELQDDLQGPASDLVVLSNARVLQRQCVPKISRGRVLGRVFAFTDITEQLQAQQQLQLAAKVFECSPDAIFITDAYFKVLQINPQAQALFSAPFSALVGSVASSLFQDPLSPDYFAQVQWSLELHGLWTGELVRMCASQARSVQVSWVALRDAQGVMTHSVGFVQDLTERKEAKQRIETLAYTDALTGLPNRLLLTQRAEMMLGMSQRMGCPCGVLFVDLDRFKNINESLGHAMGDRVLIEVAQRIRKALREVDTLGRLGADEFVVFLQEADAFGAEIAARRIIAALTQPFAANGVEFSLGCSIGVAQFPDDGRTVEGLIQCAETAMHAAKERGRGSLRFYQPQKNVDWLSRIKMEHSMRQALETNQFRLVYQPQVALKTGRLVGAEALLRWSDPDLGQVPPSTFIPLAEESGLIIQLGNWVLGEAVRQATLWQHQGRDVVVSVNVSALQFQQGDFVERVAQTLRGAGLRSHLLELELTESILVRDANEALAKLDALAALGLRLAIDDFGTGYSSLAYLKKFPISKLKIDRAFVMGLPHDESDRAIVSATIAMARALKLTVVAEGVETPAQHDYLHALQCAAYQGFLCSAGVPVAEFEHLMDTLARQSA